MPETRAMTETAPWWVRENLGIIGLQAEPWDATEPLDWPTHGYDGNIAWYSSDDDPDAHAGQNHTREEWLALADEMIRRWTAWRAHVAALP